MLGFISKVFLFFILLCVQVKFSKSSILPSFITPCYRDDPNLKECMLKEGRKTLNRFVMGIPEIGVPSLDPLQLGDFEVNHNSLKIQNKNAVMTGLKDSYLDDLLIDLEKKTGRIRLLGNSTFTADYVIDGKVLVFPITGSGKSLLKTVNYDMVINWNWDLRKGKDGKDHAFITDATDTYRMENVVIRMTGLFNNDKPLGDAMNKILNENWRELMKEVSPPSMQIVQKRIINILNKFYKHVPYDDFLPVSK